MWLLVCSEAIESTLVKLATKNPSKNMQTSHTVIIPLTVNVLWFMDILVVMDGP